MTKTAEASPLYDALPERSGAECKKTVDQSHYLRGIQHAKGELAGFSRAAGAVSPETRRVIIDLIVDEATRRGHAFRDIAYILLIARLESGFNPDASACSTSASGVMQITDNAAKDTAKKTGEAEWRKNNPADVNIDITKVEDRFNARKNIIAGIIQYERCKAKAMQVLRTVDAIVYEPRIYQYYHAGLYFDGVKTVESTKVDAYGLREFEQNIQPLLRKVEFALKGRAKFQAQLTQPDGKPYRNVEYVALVPRMLLETLTDRFFGWAQRLFAKPTVTSPVTTARNPALSRPHSAATSSSQGDSDTKPAPAPQPDKQAYPARISDGGKFDVIHEKTDANGMTAEIPVQATSEIYLCILEYDYDNKAAQLQRQREEEKREHTATSGETTETDAAPNGSEGTSTDSLNGPADADQETATDAEAGGDEINITPQEPYAFRSMTSMYCGRKPDMEKIAEGFRQIGKPFETELLEFTRSYIVKSSAALETAAPTNAAPAERVQLEHITASIKTEQLRATTRSVATVETNPDDPNGVVKTTRHTPWMDIAMKERYQQEARGTAESHPEWKKVQEEIKNKAKEGKDLNTQLAAERKKLVSQQNQGKIAAIRASIEKNKLQTAALIAKQSEIENDPSINNPRIVEYFSVTGIPESSHGTGKAVNDEIPWCAAFVSWCMSKAGYSILRPDLTARAREWANYGEEAKEGTYGAIVVVGQIRSNASGARTPSGSHVGFIVYEGKSRKGEDVIHVLGGNQSYDINDRQNTRVNRAAKINRVTITEFNKSEWAVVARRFPTKGEKK